MTDFSRVVWSEGMFLRPQHFQQQERFMLHEVAQVTSSISPYFWGVNELMIDESLLSHSQFGLTKISALMPDGCAVESPLRDMLPKAIELEKNVRDEIVYLAIPAEKVGAVNISEQGSTQITRYGFSDHDVADTNVGTDSLEVLQLAQLTLEFKLSRDSLSGYITLPIARVIEVSEEGKVSLDQKFIPPCLNANRNPVSKILLNEVYGMLKLRADALAGRLSQGQGAANSIADFMMLQLLNRYEPLFVHLTKSDGLHPQLMCQYLYSLVGELATFSDASKRPPELPVYQHDDLANVLSHIMSVLNKYMSTVLEQTATQLPLDVTKFGIRVAAIGDKGLLDRSIFVIAVKADIHGEELRRRFPSQVKIGPVEHIRDLVNNQLPGIAITALPVAPRQIPYHADYHYFQLNKNNDYWQRLSASGGIALHLSGKYPELDMQLWAIN
ncbi:type VI secretion system baseplate subunit TssK [Photobacterium lutimaris]|uniref:Type VI secretion system baseplate subunit TssK n=1 Tax=Photobacterium lutimaris TaxID=388278 RepID=A0A2T3IZJ9_9GAMM|nr:type VI secretion system baseplate subunit TssK [Photobacterium lutimaris]PSU34128.1 type VI secretion system baseplate subunit TssK [Photobacterium lutimaris]TDR75699.1 type VI secretion system protein ImpJ [Photobacterium lutimaris]